MRLEIERDSADAPEDISAYAGPCRPVHSTVEEADGRVVLSTSHEPVMLQGPMHVPDAEGGRWPADNGGEGFTRRDGPIDFRREACRTRIRQVHELAERLEGEGMPPCVPVAEAASQTNAALEAGDTDGAVERAFRAGERLVEAETEWRLQGATQLDLGINSKGLHNARAAWDEHFAGRFNYATVPLTWGVLEVEKDRPRYDVLDELVAWGREHGIRMKGHALIWHSGFEKRCWQPDVSFDELKQRSAARVRTILERIGDDLDAVELINEPVQAAQLGLSVEQQRDETETVSRICRQMAPHIRQMISLYSEDESWFPRAFRNERKGLITIAEFIERCIERGVEPDLIGLQLHMPENLFHTRQVLEYWHRRFGVPVHVTEWTPPSGAEPSVRIGGRPMEPNLKTWRGRPWTEQVQAEHVRSFLRMYRALPFVENATFWATTDAPILWDDYLLGTVCENYRLPWAAGQGLLREDLTPKPVLNAIDEAMGRTNA